MALRKVSVRPRFHGRDGSPASGRHGFISFNVVMAVDSARQRSSVVVAVHRLGASRRLCEQQERREWHGHHLWVVDGRRVFQGDEQAEGRAVCGILGEGPDA